MCFVRASARAAKRPNPSAVAVAAKADFSIPRLCTRCSLCPCGANRLLRPQIRRAAATSCRCRGAPRAPAYSISRVLLRAPYSLLLAARQQLPLGGHVARDAHHEQFERLGAGIGE